jgi:hypothetical protein
MSESNAALAEIDNPEDDVRQAIEDLKLTAEPDTRVVIDKSSTVDRARDEDGKFAKAPAEPKERRVLTLPEKTAGVQETAPAIGAAAVEAPPVAAAPVIKAPESWKPEVRGKFADLPPEVQAEINRRETDIMRGLSKQDDERSFGRKVGEIVSPYLPTIRAEGGTPEKAIESLLQTAHVLRQGTDLQKAQTVAAVISQFKVPPQALFSILQGASVVSGQPAQQAPFDPRYESLAQSVARMEQAQQQEAQQRQLQEQSELQRQIAEFGSAPGHEHFEKVRPFMGHLIESGQAKDMPDAYEKAIWADPDIRASLIAARAEPNQRVNEQVARTERARNAAGSITGSPGGAKRPTNGAANPTSSIEDDLRAAIRERDGRV